MPRITFEAAHEFKRLQRMCGTFAIARMMAKEGYSIDTALIWLAGSRRERK